MVKWSSQQDAALIAVSNWLKDRNGDQVFRLFGWAGTGKTTLAKHLASGLNSVKYAAFTGKAALAMRKRGCRGASTIHSLIYTLISDSESEPRFVLDRESPAAGADLIVIDEVSMVDEVLAHDLLSFGTKVLVLGDPFQLPPVQGTGFFITEEPDLMLTEIHRQAAENPIIQLSLDIRNGGELHRGTFGESKVISRDEVEQEDVLHADQVLVGRNRTRIDYNNRLRELKGLPHATPVLGDKIVCLRNNPRKKLLNGQIFIVSEVKRKNSGKLEMHILPEDGGPSMQEVKVTTHLDFFTGSDEQMAWAVRRQFDEFTFGYALTVHKAQGSQWDNVYLFDESFAFREDGRRWLYTGVTRAVDRITVVS